MAILARESLKKFWRSDVRGSIFQRKAPTYEKREQGIARTIAKFCNAAMENPGRKAAVHNLIRGSLAACCKTQNQKKSREAAKKARLTYSKLP